MCVRPRTVARRRAPTSQETQFSTLGAGDPACSQPSPWRPTRATGLQRRGAVVSCLRTTRDPDGIGTGKSQMRTVGWGDSSRTDLCGVRPVTGVPAATIPPCWLRDIVARQQSMGPARQDRMRHWHETNTANRTCRCRILRGDGPCPRASGGAGGTHLRGR